MSEQLENTGVDSGFNYEPEVPAAGEYEMGNPTEQSTEQNTESGVNQEPAAAGQGASEDEFQFDERTETAFARRLNTEREKIRSEIYQSVQQELEQYNPLLELAQYEAQKHGMDPISWARAVQSSREEAYFQQLQQAADEYGVDPQILMQMVNNHPQVLQARQFEQQYRQQEQQFTEHEKFNQEAAELLQEFPEIDTKTIPQEVWQLRHATGISLLDAYLRTNHKNMIADAKTKGEQAAVKALKNNAQSSPGALGGEGTEQKTGYAALSKAERKALRERVLRGENVTQI